MTDTDTTTTETDRWIVTVAMTAQPLTEEDINLLGEDKNRFDICRIDSSTDTAEIQLSVQASDYTQAVTTALAAFAASAGIQRLIANGVLGRPHTFNVCTEAAHAATLPLLGPAEAAHVLGISGARFRDLRATAPRFPAPAVTLELGELYRREDMEAYDRIRKRPPGRPRKITPTG